MPKEINHFQFDSSEKEDNKTEIGKNEVGSNLHYSYRERKKLGLFYCWKL